MCPLCYQNGGSLLHCLSTLTGKSRRFISVALVWESPPPDVIRHPALRSPDCTGLGVTSTGRYPASCPAKPGLSSSEPFRLFSRDYLAWLRKRYFITFFQTCKENLHIKTTSSDKFPQKRIIRHFFAWNRNKIIKEFQKPFCFLVFRLIFFNLHIKTTSSDKFPQKRIIRHFFAWNRNKIIKEFQKPFCFLVFRLIFFNPKK